MSSTYPDLKHILIKDSFESEQKDIRALNHLHKLVYVVLDDDPTGTQTVHDVSVLTTWGLDELKQQFLMREPVFFILTNSRSLSEESAKVLGRQIGKNLKQAATETKSLIRVISRSDSTLRGHFPAEVGALEKGLNCPDNLKIIVPAFIEGSRFTIDDVHYILDEEALVPVSETQFARDHTFGYGSSNLRDWIIEKSRGEIQADSVFSIALEDIRKKNTKALASEIKQIPKASYVVVNAASYYDLYRFSSALLKSEMQFTARSSASFINAITATPPLDLLSAVDVVDTEGKGSLIVVGSYVDKTTRQVNKLLESGRLEKIQVIIAKILSKDSHEYLESLTRELNAALVSNKDIVLFTERKLIDHFENLEPLEIGNRVSIFLTKVVSGISVRPKFILAKGGITSSDIATKSLHIKRATVMGQVHPGVPVWKTGSESLFPGISYIIFPGNVGADDTLLSLFEKFTNLHNE